MRFLAIRRFCRLRTVALMVAGGPISVDFVDIIATSSIMLVRLSPDYHARVIVVIVVDRASVIVN